jgi:ADP-dependent phosphofructokinase/glucokinase
MRDNIIDRIIALSDEQLQELLILIQQSEEASRVSEVPRQTSA